MASLNNIKYIINQKVRKCKCKNLEQFFNRDIKTYDLYLEIMSRFNIEIDIVTYKDIENINKRILPALIEIDKKEYIILAINKDELKILDIEKQKTYKVKKTKIKKRIGYIYLFSKKIDNSLLYTDQKWIFEFFKQDSKELSKVFLMTLFSTLFVFAMPLYIMSLYDRVIPTSGYSTLLVLTGGVLILLLFNYIFTLVKNEVIKNIDLRLLNKFEELIYQKMLKLHPEYDKMESSNKYLLFKEVETIKEYYLNNLVNIIVELPIYIIGILLLFTFTKGLWVIPIIITIIMVLTMFYYQRKLHFSYELVYKFERNYVNVLFDKIKNKEMIAQSNKINKEVITYSNEKFDYDDVFINIKTLHKNFGQLMNFFVQLNIVIFIFFGTIQIINVEMSIGYLLAFFLLLNRMLSPIVQLNVNYLKYFEIKKSISNISNFLLLPEINDKQENIDTIYLKKAPKVIVNNISFKYDNRYIVQNFNLTLEPNETTLILGYNGVGKTTILKLLLGRNIPTEGKILIDYKDLDNLDKNQYSSQISKMLDTKLPKGNVGEYLSNKLNISINSLEKRIEQKKLVFLTEMIPHLLNINIEEDEKNISKGEKKIIELFLVFLEDKPMILLDEPLEGLTPPVRNRLLQHIKEIQKNKTIVITTNDPDYYVYHNVPNKMYQINDLQLFELKANSEK